MVKQTNFLISSSSHLLISTYAGIDRNTAERFRKGQYPIDATLDLHGLSRDKAQAALHPVSCNRITSAAAVACW